MATLVNEKVDYRLLNMLSNLVICSRCLRAGKVTPVPQMISSQRDIQNFCSHCRDEQASPGRRAKLGQLLKFPRAQRAARQ
tara:strand:+ start:3234 stop:3476 length:243 start_codon:yes stop_codon:yes gene_type:complete